MNNKFAKCTQFLITIAVTAVIVFVVCFVVELVLLFKCENYVTKNELNMANLVHFATIEQLEKYLTSEPNNYVAMIRLANIYEQLDKKQDANKLYLKAIKVSARSYYALYNYALFCAKQNMYAISSSLAEEIAGNSKKNIKYKMEIYEAIGDNMLEVKEYEGAVKAYQIAYKYAKNINNKKTLDKIITKFSNSHIKLADMYIKQNKIADAITALNNSLKAKHSSMALYKLALIYIDTDKIKAQKLIEKVFTDDPYIVNPYIYNSLLNELIHAAEVSGNQNALNYYSVKYDRFKNTMEDLYLYKDDILISDTYVEKKKDSYVLSFDLKNNTKIKIDQLYLDIEIFLNTKRYKLTKKVVHLAKTLGPFEEMKDYKIILPSNMQFIDIADHNYLIIKYYAKKSVKAPDTLVKIDSFNF